MTGGRPLSPVERLWWTAGMLSPPFANTLVVEGHGTSPAVEQLRELLPRACEAAPGLALRYVAAPWRASWAPGDPPVVSEVDGSGWAGCAPEGAPWLEGSWPEALPATRIFRCTGPTPRIVIQTLHASTDGRGTLQLADALFAAWRGEPPPRSNASAPTDDQVALRLGRGPEPQVRPDAVAPLPVSALTHPRWARVRWTGTPTRLVPRLLSALAELVPAGPGRIRLDVSVDLRRHGGCEDSTANLAGIVRIDASDLRGRRSTESVSVLDERLRKALLRNEDLAFIAGIRPSRLLPVGLLTTLGRRGARRAMEQGRFSTTATISNLGRVDLRRLDAPGFRASAAFFVPPGSPSLPFFLAVTGHEGGVDLVGTAPASVEDLQALLHQLVRALGP